MFLGDGSKTKKAYCDKVNGKQDKADQLDNKAT